ncbi:MAG: hypothetical protein ACXVXP_05460 [Mycobacteriaceae bacterium]
MSCNHISAIWQVDIIDCATDPGLTDWECTRCGQRWPAAEPPQPAGGAASGLVAV